MKKLILKLVELYKKPHIKMAVNYIFFGVCTTLVNVVSYYLLSQIGLDRVLANFISITLSILFAYFVNSRYVFDSKVQGKKKIFSELLKFFTARLFTMLIEILGVEVLVWIGIGDFVSKLITQIIVLVVNYLISKFLVFNKK